MNILKKHQLEKNGQDIEMQLKDFHWKELLKSPEKGLPKYAFKTGIIIGAFVLHLILAVFVALLVIWWGGSVVVILVSIIGVLSWSMLLFIFYYILSKDAYNRLLRENQKITEENYNNQINDLDDKNNGNIKLIEQKEKKIAELNNEKLVLSDDMEILKKTNIKNETAILKLYKKLLEQYFNPLMGLSSKSDIKIMPLYDIFFYLEIERTKPHANKIREIAKEYSTLFDEINKINDLVKIDDKLSDILYKMLVEWLDFKKEEWCKNVDREIIEKSLLLLDYFKESLLEFDSIASINNQKHQNFQEFRYIVGFKEKYAP